MDTAKSSRFKDAPWFPKEEEYVVIGGAGGIGSWLALLITRAGWTPIVYDFDLIEEHNIGGQLYGQKHVTKNKVNALQEVVQDFTSISIMPFNEKVTSKTANHHFMFSAFDNMQARKDMFAAWKAGLEDEEYRKNAVFIDGRLTMEQLQIFCVTPENMEKYETEHLFDDSEVEDAPCTLKQTSHSAAMIASHMVGFFTNHITNLRAEDSVRQLPFMWEYFIPVNYVNEL